MAIRKVTAITGWAAAQKHKNPAAAGSCQPAGSTASAATQGERNDMRQRNTFGAETMLLCVSRDPDGISEGLFWSWTGAVIVLGADKTGKGRSQRASSYQVTKPAW